MATLAALITSCRTLAGDGATDNFMRAENCNNPENGNVIDGTNKSFSVANFPVVPGGFMVFRVDNRVVPSAEVDEALGNFDLEVAPITSVYATYYYYLFPDTVWTEFVEVALEQCNLSTGVPFNDVPAVPGGLLAVIKQFVNYYFAMRMAEQTGLWFNQRLQERSEDRDNISRKWLAIAESKMKNAVAMLALFYAGAGTASAPAFAVGGWQPLPYTPYR